MTRRKHKSLLPPKLATIDVINSSVVARAKSIQESRYTNNHHLIQEKIIPDSLVALRTELDHMAHFHIALRAKKEKDFEGAIGQIAACLSIALDGSYEPDNLFSMLVDALRAKRNGSPYIPPEGIMTDLEERENSIELKENKLESWLKNLHANAESSIADSHTLFMLEQGCDQCDNRTACRAAARCLGDDSTAEIG